MKKSTGATRISLAAALLLQGGVVVAAPARDRDAAPVAAAQVQGNDQVVATIAGRSVTMGQLLQPLVEAHGLTVLLNLVQLELAKDAAEKQGVTVTEADFAAERKATLDKLFAEGDEKTQDKIDQAVRKNQPEEAERLRKEMERDHEQLFEQFLQNQKVTRPEFELFLKTNTYLRKIAEPKVEAAITDDDIKNSFDAEYGESVRVRIIQGNPNELGRALERIRAGESFEVVARQVSRHPTSASLGGEFPRFSRATAGLPDNFKLAAFALKEGEVSGMVEAEGTYFLIKLEKRFAPKAVKLENVRDSVRANLKERTVQAAVKKYRDALADQARQQLNIAEPVMAGQFAARLAEREKQIKDQKDLRRQMERDRERDAARTPSTEPGDLAPPTGANLLPGGGGGGIDPAAVPARPPAGAGGSPASPLLHGNDSKNGSAPNRPGIVVPVRPRPGLPADPAAPAPARATEPAQGTPTAPADPR